MGTGYVCMYVYMYVCMYACMYLAVVHRTLLDVVSAHAGQLPDHVLSPGTGFRWTCMYVSQVKQIPTPNMVCTGTPHSCVPVHVYRYVCIYYVCMYFDHGLSA